MVNYNLVVKYVDGVKINIPFERFFLDKNYNEKYLPNIDYFTSHFKDKYELIESLEFFDFIKKREVKKKIVIEYKFNGTTKEDYIIYSNDLKFFDIDYMKAYFIYNSDNIKFLTFIYNLFKDNPIQKKNLEILNIYINKYNYGFYSVYNFDSELDEENNIEALEDIIKRQIYKYDLKEKKYIFDEFGNEKYNYKQFRDLAKALSNYMRKNNSNEEIEEFENEYYLTKDPKWNIKRFTKKK